MENDTEILFYRAYHSFLLQNPDFRTDYEIFLDQYKNFPDSFKRFNKQDVLRIKHMQDSYKTGQIILFEGANPFQNIEPPPKGEKSDKNHKDLCMNIYLKKEEILEPYTGTINSITLEFPVLYGDIDILVLNGMCAYIVEVKTCPAEHDIIGQMMKYFISLSLKLILKHFNEIKMISICPGYNSSAYNGLRQIGVIPLLIDTKDSIIKY